MLNRQLLINEINSKLAWIKAIVELNGSLNLLDCNIHMEHFLVGLLDRVYGYSLVNLNSEEANFTSIDLGDRKKRIAFQVTSDNTSTKIKETLKKFFEMKYDNDFDTLIVIIIGTKKNYTTQFQTQNGFDFSPGQHVWDFTKIYKDISSKDTVEIENIALYLRQELAPSNGYVGSGPYSVATEMKRRARALCVSKLTTPGISTKVAEAIVDADLQTSKYNYILDEARSGKHYLIGGFGCGKSHAVLILCQQLLDLYSNGSIDAIPLYAHVREIRTSGSIQDWISNKPICGAKYILFIDGLDEVDYAFATKIIEEERFLCSLYPDNLIIICSRPLTYLPDKSSLLQIHCLTQSEQIQLIQNISERAAMYFHPRTLTKEMTECIQMPLFCIIYALLRGIDNLGLVKNRIDLITVFIDKALKGISETNKTAYHDLMNLSICAVKNNYGDVDLSEVTLNESINTILKTGLVEKEANYVTFPLAIVPQYLAAKALQHRLLDPIQILSTKEQIYQWKYPLSILFSQAPFEETFDLFAAVFRCAPGAAAQIISDGTRSDNREKLPPASECGEKMLRCMKVWESALGPLTKYLVPKSNDGRYTLTVSTNGRSLAYNWYSVSTSEEVTVTTHSELMNTIGMHAGPIPAQSNWPWIVTFKMLTDSLTDCINKHSIQGSCDQLAREFFWRNALLMANKGSLCHNAIPISVFDSYKKYEDCKFNFKGVLVDVPTFLASLKQYVNEETQSIYPPFPVGDKDYSRYVWSCYSPERFLELARFVFSNALKEYLELMRSEFSHLAGEIYTAQLMPCRLIGSLKFDPVNELDAGPVLSWHFWTLPIGQTCDVDIDYRSNTTDLEDAFDSVYENRKKLRPGIIGGGFITRSQVLRLNCPTPVTDIIYDWLRQDLRDLGWINIC